MGAKLPNLIQKIDHATGRPDRSFELHMDLPLSPAQHSLVSNLLAANDWDGARDALTDAYPQHAELLNLWFAASDARRKRESRKGEEVALGSKAAG